MKQILLSTLILASVRFTAQQGNTYRMTSGELYAKTVDGGWNTSTHYVLHFEAEYVGVCTYTLRSEQKKEQLLGSMTYNDWQYFKWQKKDGRLLITGLPPVYDLWATLQIQADALIGIKNKSILFKKLEQPGAAKALVNKSYAVNIGADTYLVFIFDKEYVWQAYMKNIAQQGTPLLTYDADKPPKQYKWLGLGTDILIPGYDQLLTADFEAQQLRLLYNGKYMTLKQEELYESPACQTVEIMKERGKSKGKKKATVIRRYGPVKPVHQ